MAWFWNNEEENNDRSHYDNCLCSEVDGNKYDNGSYQYCDFCEKYTNFKWDRCDICHNN
ncbi:MAG: hypothetical protein ACRDA3_13230 [Peptostreptococcaceae bacterium]